MYKIDTLSPDHLYLLIGRNIQQIRKHHGMTQEQLAELINGEQKYISKIESGKARPNLLIYLKIANVFGVSINEFLIGISERNRQSVDIAIPPQHYLGDGEKKFMNGVLETLIQYLSTKEQ